MMPGRKTSWFRIHADAILLALFSFGLLAALNWGISKLESAIGTLLVFVLPGWLLTRLLFGERPFELEIEVLLILFLSAFLISLEVLPLLYFRVEVNRTLFVNISLVTNWTLLLILKIKTGTFSARQFKSVPIHWTALLAAVVVPLVLLGFGLLHLHETHESFTEFRLASDVPDSAGSLLLEVASHEETVQFFSLVCQAEGQEGAEQTVLGNFEVGPGETKAIMIAYSRPLAQNTKLKLSLDQHKGLASYRWLEVPGDDCGQITAVVQ